MAPCPLVVSHDPALWHLADAPRRVCLLSVRRDWPRRRAKSHDEIAPSQLIELHPPYPSRGVLGQDTPSARIKSGACCAAGFNPTYVCSGSCVTSVAVSPGGAQLYERALRGRRSGADSKPPQAAAVKSR